MCLYLSKFHLDITEHLSGSDYLIMTDVFVLNIPDTLFIELILGTIFTPFIIIVLFAAFVLSFSSTYSLKFTLHQIRFRELNDRFQLTTRNIIANGGQLEPTLFKTKFVSKSSSIYDRRKLNNLYKFA